MKDGRLKSLNKLKTARGQIDGVIKMIEDDRYCVDISIQILSLIGLLKKSNIDILDSHIRTCVRTAIKKGGIAEKEKLDEIIKIIDRYIK